jgi:hypothetical protein
MKPPSVDAMTMNDPRRMSMWEAEWVNRATADRGEQAETSADGR